MVPNSEVANLRHVSTIISIGAELPAFEFVNEAALDSYAKGEYGKAEELFRRELNYRDALLGRCPATFTSMNNLAMSLSKLGRYEEACALYKDCLCGLESLLEKDHEDTLCVKCNLAASFYQLRQMTDAEKLYHDIQHIRQSIRRSIRLDKAYTELDSFRHSLFILEIPETKVLESESDTSPTQEEHTSDSKKSECVQDETAGDTVHTMPLTAGDLPNIKISPVPLLPWKLERENDLHAIPFDRPSQIQIHRRPSSMSNLFGSFSGRDIRNSISVKLRDAWLPHATTLAFQNNENSPLQGQLGHLRSSSANGFPRISTPLPITKYYEFPRDPPPILSPVLYYSPLPEVHYKDVGPPPVPHLMPLETNIPNSSTLKHPPSAPAAVSSPQELSFKERIISVKSDLASHHRNISILSLDTSSPLGDSVDGEASMEDSPRQCGVVQLVDVSINEARGSSLFTIRSIITDRTFSSSSNDLKRTLDIEVFRADKINTYPISALLDTGSDADFISETLRELLDYKLEPEIYDGPRFIDASSHVFKPVGIVKIFFRWHNDGSESLMKRKFAVASDLPPDMNMILGKKFIDQYEVLRYNDKFLPIRLTPLSEEQIAEVRDVSEKARKANEEKEAKDAERERLRRQKYREDAKKRLDGA